MQETVLERRPLDLDMVGELEHALERARGDALIKGLALLLLGPRLLVAADRQRVVLHLDLEVRLAKSGNGYRNAIVVLAGPLDVVGRITRGAVVASHLIEEGEQPVEANGRTIEGSKIESSHGISSFVERHADRSAHRARPELSCSREACTTPIWERPTPSARGRKTLFFNRKYRLSESRNGEFTCSFDAFIERLPRAAIRRSGRCKLLVMNLVSIPANPVPEGAVVGTLKTADAIELRYARWDPPPGRKGTVCLFQGRSEYIEKYFETVRDLRSRGFAVATLDWRGQGLSQRALRNRRKGYVEHFDEYNLDLDAFINEVVLPDCPPPHFALAHSMGASVLIRAAHRGNRAFDRMVLLAPMIQLPGLRRTLATRVIVKAMRLAGLGTSYVPGGDAPVMQP